MGIKALYNLPLPSLPPSTYATPHHAGLLRLPAGAACPILVPRMTHFQMSDWMSPLWEDFSDHLCLNQTSLCWVPTIPALQPWLCICPLSSQECELLEASAGSHPRSPEFGPECDTWKSSTHVQAINEGFLWLRQPEGRNGLLLAEDLAASSIFPSLLRPRELQDSSVSLGTQEEGEERGPFVPLADG